MADNKQPKKARPVEELYEVGLNYDVPLAYVGARRDTSLAAEAKRLQAWVNDVNDLIREHKGRCDGKLYAVLRKREQCSLCHNPWELEDDDVSDERPCCAHCGADVEENETDGG